MTDLAIRELSKLTGFSAAMIRYFERAGVISPPNRTPAGYRIFGPHHVKELAFVARMQELGFYGQQIKAIRAIQASDQPLEQKREEVNRIFEEHLRYVEEKAAYFFRLEASLRTDAPRFAEEVLEADG